MVSVAMYSFPVRQVDKDRKVVSVGWWVKIFNSDAKVKIKHKPFTCFSTTYIFYDNELLMDPTKTI